MAQKTRTALTTIASTVTNETIEGANSKTRIGGFFTDISDSAFNLESDDSDSITEGSSNLFANATNLGAVTNSATAKTTPIDADSIGLVDSEASSIWKKVTWANIKATLKTYFDTLYATIASVSAKQDTLVSGTNIKSINGVSLLGSGDLGTLMSVSSADNTTTDVQFSGLTGKLGYAIFTGDGDGFGRELYINTAENTSVPACGYYEYVASLSQTGTSAPVPTVIKNTYPQGLPTLARSVAGNFSATLAGAFTLGKAISSITNQSNQSSGDYGDIMIQQASVNSFIIETLDASGVLSDDILGQVYPNILTIRTYL
jgi:hypothetical protein